MIQEKPKEGSKKDDQRTRDRSGEQARPVVSPFRKNFRECDPTLGSPNLRTQRYSTMVKVKKHPLPLLPNSRDSQTNSFYFSRLHSTDPPNLVHVQCNTNAHKTENTTRTERKTNAWNFVGLGVFGPQTVQPGLLGSGFYSSPLLIEISSPKFSVNRISSFSNLFPNFIASLCFYSKASISALNILKPQAWLIPQHSTHQTDIIITP